MRYPRIDITGQKFGRWTAISYAGEGSQLWNVVCDCGTVSKVPSGNLRYSKSMSCGCIAREKGEARRIRLGERRKNRRLNGDTSNPAYKCWSMMHVRCTNPNYTHYAYYGGRGISVCDRWVDFNLFLEDMGPRPEGATLDRADPDGNYTPENCRWATRKEQVRNRRNTVFVRVNGSVCELWDLADREGINRSHIYHRLWVRDLVPSNDIVDMPPDLIGWIEDHRRAA